MSDDREPWWGTLRISACRSAAVPSSDDWADRSASPGSSTRPTGVCARSTTDVSLTALPSSPSTCGHGADGAEHLERQRRASAARSRGPSPTTGARAAVARPAGDLRQGVRRLARRPERDPTHRPARQRPGEPADVVGVQVGQHHQGERRGPRGGRGSRRSRPRRGPTSTRTARPGSPVASTSASPCPTSHATTDHPAGGHPGGTTRVGHQHQQRARRAPPRAPRGAGATAAPARRRAPPRRRARARPATPPGHASVAPRDGRAAPGHPHQPRHPRAREPDQRLAHPRSTTARPPRRARRAPSPARPAARRAGSRRPRRG